MNNSKFWEAYKAKCEEKGLPPLYTSAEEFDKAMDEPPRPYSTGDLNATSNESNVDLPKRREWDELMGVDDIDVEDMEMIEEDSKEEDMAKKVEWKRCNICTEMKEESEFAHVRGGGLQKTCKKCMAQKISAGHKKHDKSIDALKPLIEEQKVLLSESKPLFLPEDACDAADAIRFALHVKEETPLLKEAKPLMAMSAEAFEAAILFAYEKGKEDAEVLDIEEITPIGAESFAMQAILRLKEGA